MSRKLRRNFFVLVAAVVFLIFFYGILLQNNLLRVEKWPFMRTTTTTTTTPAPTTTTRPVTRALNITSECDSDMPDLRSITNNMTFRLLELAGVTTRQQFHGLFAPDRRLSSYRRIAARYPEVQPGGAWRPSDEDRPAPSRVAIIVPYRDREEHLRVFLNVMHGFLQKQKLEYRIFVVEQTGGVRFNRASLFNVGVYEALRTGDTSFQLSDLAQLADVFVGPHAPIRRPRRRPSTTPAPTTPRPTTSSSNSTSTTAATTTTTTTFTPLVSPKISSKQLRRLAKTYSRLRETFECFAFHDVDLLPENDRIPYSCPTGGPRHLIAANEKFSYKPIYDAYFGGVTIVSLDQLLLSNGFSNQYFGWGGEDDDFARRIGLFWTVARCPTHIGRYGALSHVDMDATNQTSPERYVTLGKWRERWKVDGLNSMQYCPFRVVSRTDEPLFTRILVHFDEWYLP